MLQNSLNIGIYNKSILYIMNTKALLTKAKDIFLLGGS